MARHLAWGVGLLMLATACSGGNEPPAHVGPVRVDCSTVPPGAISAADADALARTIELWHDAKLLEHIDARPELVCARLTLRAPLPRAWRSWQRKPVAEEVGVAGYVVARSGSPRNLLAELFARGAPHGRVLGLAARRGFDEVMVWLLEQGVDPRSGDALLEAAAAAELPVLKVLIEAGVHPDQEPSAGSVFDQDRPTPLFFALTNRRRDIVEVLLDVYADADRATRFGGRERAISYLEVAIDEELWQVVERLVEEGADAEGLPAAKRRQLRRAAEGFRMESVLAVLD
ncbi:MAG: ankyrin repeat domain-containing protein [Myxococcota bacterium]|nr:ankyrin repeat domain-containing protein [Myxococcota bacterium]